MNIDNFVLKTRPSKKIIIAIVTLVAAFTLFQIFAKPEEQINYLTETVRSGDIIRTVNATGEVAAVQLVNVGAQVSGQIKKLAVAAGQSVKRGDLIAEIDSTTQENDLAINKAKLSTYQAQLVSRELALRVAASQFEREQMLKKRNAASEESLENAENTHASAQSAVEEMKSLIIQAEISVSTAETNLGYTRILAPLDGTVVSVPVEEGQTVNANQTAPTIVQVADLRQMEIRMQISEGDVTKVKPGMGVSYTILSEPDRTFTGTLRSVDPGLTTLSDGSYTGSTDAGTAVYYYGKLVADNADGALRIGMTTQNTITIAEAKGVLLVPSIAVTRHEGRSFVQVLVDGQAEEREIQIGLSDNMNTQVVEGLAEGDQVVAAQMSASELAAGAAVRMRRGGLRL
ncbi:MAG: efflux RND transporter periplasmic adaptor subunit [Candidatus Adiutrix sp.]|jgi:macrolide-specific efflux system membrane fusion protein|nr:efflux RND transporter periplasmic adaptor subunit [Candidatus Adiutrix sp.]